MPGPGLLPDSTARVCSPGMPTGPGRYSGRAMSQTRSVYLDHAATTPMHPAAIEAMTAVLATVGNAS